MLYKAKILSDYVEIIRVKYDSEAVRDDNWKEKSAKYGLKKSDTDKAYWTD